MAGKRHYKPAVFGMQEFTLSTGSLRLMLKDLHTFPKGFLTFHPNGHRAVVGDLDQHVSAELAGLGGNALEA